MRLFRKTPRRLRAEDYDDPLDRARAHMFVSPRYGVGVLTSAKAGSTFLKSLMWHLESGGHDYHDVGERNLPKGMAVPLDSIRSNRRYIVCLRHPVARFTSLYFEKLLSPKPEERPAQAFHALAAEFGRFEIGAETVEAHRRNLDLTLDVVDATIRGAHTEKLNPHWMPQAMWLRRSAAPLGLVAVTLEGLSWQLPLLWEEAVPDIGEKLINLNRNASTAAKMRKPVLTPALRQRIRAIYPADMAAWKATDAAWNGLEGRTEVETVPQIGFGPDRAICVRDLPIS